MPHYREFPTVWEDFYLTIFFEYFPRKSVSGELSSLLLVEHRIINPEVDPLPPTNYRVIRHGALWHGAPPRIQQSSPSQPGPYSDRLSNGLFPVPVSGTKHRVFSEFFFDAQELVVFGHAVGTGRGTGFDLTAIRGHGNIRDRGILGFAAAMA